MQLYSNASDEITGAVKLLTRTLEAWRGVSTAGTDRVVRAAGALMTLQEHALFAPSPVPAPGALKSVFEDVGTQTEWLRCAHVRLSRASKALIENRENISMRADTSVANVPVFATLDARGWSKLYDRATACLLGDLEDKARVVQLLDDILDGVSAPDRDALEVAAETWLEMPKIVPVDVDILPAALSAEMEAERELSRLKDEIMKSANVTPIRGGSFPSVKSPAGKGSPALNLLLSGGGSAKKKKKR